MTDPAQNTDEFAGQAPVDPSRIGSRPTHLRRHVARGVVVNSCFDVGLAGLSGLQRIVVAAFLTRAEVGLWAIALLLVVNLLWLKDLGIADKYIQQSDPDQELAFQRAFTLELVSSLAFFVLLLAVVPLGALVYGRPAVIAPAMLLALVVPISAFESPGWIPYRSMQYGRQRLLTGIDPIVTFTVTVGLAIAGAGYWCFVFGALAGSLAGAVVCTITCPYPLRWRYDRATTRSYVSFSWPLVASGASRLILVQASILVANNVVGLAGVGTIGIATGIATFTDRVDAIVSQTIYPAVCAVVHRTELLAEAFVKSNRLALMWAMPFGVGVALFSNDVVNFFLGQRWHSAIGLLAAFGLSCALGQVAFNWAVFMRAVNLTRPLLVAAAVYTAVFLGVAIPAMLSFGVAGYAAGFAAAQVTQIALRGYYMRRLFRGFNVVRQLIRAAAPTVPAAAIVLGMRALNPGEHSAGWAVAEVSLFAVAVAASTFLLERDLVTEMTHYLFRRSRPLAGLTAQGPVERSPA